MPTWTDWKWFSSYEFWHILYTANFPVLICDVAHSAQMCSQWGFFSSNLSSVNCLFLTWDHRGGEYGCTWHNIWKLSVYFLRMVSEKVILFDILAQPERYLADALSITMLWLFDPLIHKWQSRKVPKRRWFWLSKRHQKSLPLIKEKALREGFWGKASSLCALGEQERHKEGQFDHDELLGCQGLLGRDFIGPMQPKRNIFRWH